MARKKKISVVETFNFQIGDHFFELSYDEGLSLFKQLEKIFSRNTKSEQNPQIDWRYYGHPTLMPNMSHIWADNKLSLSPVGTRTTTNLTK